MLHWRLPQELGGRGDLLFNVVCKECGGHREPSSGGACRRCRDEVHFDPRQRGLTESRVLVGGLRAHVPYILEVQAVNGVSELSPDPPQAAAINVSTSHEGEPFSFSAPQLPSPHPCFPASLALDITFSSLSSPPLGAAAPRGSSAPNNNSPLCTAVPSAVPVMHQVSRAANSITVSWPQPEQTNGNILDYQLRYYDQVSQALPQGSEGSQPPQPQPCMGVAMEWDKEYQDTREISEENGA